MAGITQSMPTSFKVEILNGIHAFGTTVVRASTTADVYKIALFRATASLVGTYDASTTNYSNMTSNGDEATGTGYVAGGNTLTTIAPTSSGTTALTDFNDTTWATSTITASGAMIYNSSQGNKAVAILNFGGDKISTAGNFTIVFPAATSTNAIIRIA